MGCGGSKLDDQSLVALCRERKHHLKAASEYRYALAESHVAYFLSLNDVGEAILRFVEEQDKQLFSVESTLPSPVLTLPNGGKKKRRSNHHHISISSSPSNSSISHSIEGSSLPRKGSGAHNSNEGEGLEDSHLHLSSPSHSSSGSGSGHGHIRFRNSDSPAREEEEKRNLFHNNNNDNNYNDDGFNNFGINDYYYPNPGYDPYPGFDPGYDPYRNPNGYPFSGGNFNAYYMRKSATQARTVVYEDPGVNEYSGLGYSSGNGFFGYSPEGAMGYSSPGRRETGAERPPPAPPSPPTVSAWDYFNVFRAEEGFYPAGYGYGSITSSPDSKEVREREGIPDLEDEVDAEVVKEAYLEKEEIKKRKKKKVGEEDYYDEEMRRNFGEGSSGSVPIPGVGDGSGKGIKSSVSPDTFRSPESVVLKDFTGEDEEMAQFSRKKSVSFEVEEAGVDRADLESSRFSSLTTLSALGSRDLQEVVREIRDEFESATSCGKEVAVMLEVGKLPYQRRSTLLKEILSRILYLVFSHPPTTPSGHMSSRTKKMAQAYSGVPGADFYMNPRNLSSTLQKLYVWEKKLYKEVKDEERLRAVYDKLCKRLQTLDERGAESSKIDATQASIRKLLTKINVCIRAVDAISSKIHKLRDEELQPQITELIYGLMRMWKSMLRCHQKQFQAIMESKIRSFKAGGGLLGDSGLKATIDLENELMNWCTRFNKWISSQKLCVESLNKWLFRCLNREPEDTADGPAPFSPGRLGAPPIFVICHDWHQAMVAISEKTVENAMLDFASKLHQLWERQDEEQRQRNKAEHVRKDFEKRLRTLRMERGRAEQEQDTLSDKTVSKSPSESGISRFDDLKVDLDLMKKKLIEERARHKEAAKLVQTVASSTIQGGLVPIFEALGNFSSEVLKAHEQVRLQYSVAS